MPNDNSKMSKLDIKKSVACILLSGVCLISSGGVSASNKNDVKATNIVVSNTEKQLTSKQITRQVGVNIYVDGKPYIPVDANGNEVRPFIYKDTTYLPLRAIADVFGCAVFWDQNDKVVVLTMNDNMSLTNNSNSRKDTSLSNDTTTAFMGVEVYYDKGDLNILPFIPKDAKGNVVEILNVGGTTFLPARALSNLFGQEIGWDGATKRVYIGKQYAIEQPIVTDTPSLPSDDYIKYYLENAQTIVDYQPILKAHDPRIDERKIALIRDTMDIGQACIEIKAYYDGKEMPAEVASAMTKLDDITYEIFVRHTKASELHPDARILELANRALAGDTLTNSEMTTIYIYANSYKILDNPEAFYARISDEWIKSCVDEANMYFEIISKYMGKTYKINY